MGKVRVTECPIRGLYVIEPAVYEDCRGYFTETYNQRDLARMGLNVTFVQDNQSKSAKGVIRGLHFQLRHPQGKLVRVIRGQVFDVAVDLRKDSVTFGRWYGIELSEYNKKQLYIPEGFAHGFLVQSDTAELCYKVTDFYDPDDQYGIIWNDRDLAICWPGVVSSGDGGFFLNDGTPLIVDQKDMLWPCWMGADY